MLISVSYTHLDVYKRQELTLIGEKAEICADARIGCGVMPVSYTHLNDGNWFNRAAELMDAGFISLGAR